MQFTAIRGVASIIRAFGIGTLASIPARLVPRKPGNPPSLAALELGLDGVTPCPTESGLSGLLTEEPKMRSGGHSLPT